MDDRRQCHCQTLDWARLVWLGCLGLREGVEGQRLLGSNLAIGVPRQHDLHLDTQNTLPQQHVPAGSVHVVVARVSRVDHEAVHELHGLGPLAPKLARHDNLATLGSRLHDEPEDSVAGASHSKTSDKLVPEGLSLSNSTETPSGHLLSIELHSALGEVEPLLDHGGELTDPAALLSEHVLGARGHDDDLSAVGVTRTST